MLNLGNRKIGAGAPCFIIAEAGVNHNGDPALARRLVEAAAAAGADAVKFQTFDAALLTTAGAGKAAYQRAHTDSTESQLEMLRRLELSRQDHRDLMAYCDEKRLLFMSTPFEEQSCDFLDEIGVPIFKVPSGEITNLPFLAHIARKGKPMILSTGMAYLGEVEQAVRTLRAAGNDKLVLLHCVSNYPAAPVDINLRAMQTMATAFGVPVGYSDHTMGIEIPLAAVALGACVIEKHFTLDRNLPGPDHQASLEPPELAALVQGIRKVEAALGHGRKEPAASELETAKVARKSLVTTRAIPAGTPLMEDMIGIKRPGTGLPPALLPYIVGRVARVDVPADSLLKLEWLA
jgi:N-acetylneuraminate synthase